MSKELPLRKVDSLEALFDEETNPNPVDYPYTLRTAKFTEAAEAEPAFAAICPGCRRFIMIPVAYENARRWTISDGPQGPTITPSLLCGCGFHYWIRDGRAIEC